MKLALAEDSQNFSVGGRAIAGPTSLEKERLSLHSECSRRFPMYFLVSLRSLRFLNMLSNHISWFSISLLCSSYALICSNFHYGLFYIAPIYEQASTLWTRAGNSCSPSLQAVQLCSELRYTMYSFGLTDFTFIDPSFSLR